MDLIAHVMAQVHHGIGRVQAAAVGDDDLLAGSLGDLPRRIVQHAGTQAAGIIVPLEDVEIRAAFASLPELGVVRQFGEGDRLIAQRRVDPHDLQARRQAENLRLREFLARQLERFLLDFAGQPLALVLRLDEQARIGDIPVMPPGFDVAESGKTARICVQGDDRLVFQDLGGQVFRRTGSKAGTLVLVDRFKGFHDLRDEPEMGSRRLRNDKIIHFYTVKCK